MGIYDGILLCSDWDGTLFYKGEISLRAVNAIKYFQQNGGYFSICSGRGPQYIKSHEDKVKPNTYSIVHNGSLIIDNSSGEELRKLTVDGSVMQVARNLMSSGYFDHCTLNYREGIETVKEQDFNNYAINTKIFPEFGYMLVAKDEDLIPNAFELLRRLNRTDIKAVKSWRLGLELIPKDSGKGSAVSLLKKHLGARISVAVGDYDNDCDMLSTADISYAVANASPLALTAAKRLTKSVWEDAIVEIIEDLKNEAL